MIEQTQHGTMFTGQGVAFFRMKMQLHALQFRVKTGMELSRAHAIVPMIKREYGLKGNAAKVLEQFEKLFKVEQDKQLVVVELPAKPAKVKRLPLGVKPDYVLWPTEQRGEGWMLGKAEPDVKGYTPTNRFFVGGSKEAEAYCVAEAAARGISKAQHEAAVGSSMFPTSYFHQLPFARGRKAGSRKGVKP